MTRDDIIRMAREAGLGAALTHDGGEPRVWIEGSDWHNELERFAALVAAAEREACARVCDEERKFWKRHEGRRDGAESCAAAIRARGEK